LITASAISSKLGDIGELYGAAAVYVFYHKKAKNVNELLDEFIKNGFSSGGTKITGKDLSATFYEDADKFGPGGIEVRDADNNLIGYRLNYTQDKVDFEVEVSDGQIARFSAKNYADTSNITLLSGNLYGILEENKPMLYHLMNVLTDFEDGMRISEKDTDFQQIYNISKLTVGIKALIGGIRAVDKSGNIIHTAQADYLLVNNNRTGRTQVIPTKKICDKMEGLLDYINIRPDALRQSRSIGETNFKNRFSNIHVTLRLREL
jgi:hypothetical protein